MGADGEHGPSQACCNQCDGRDRTDPLYVVLFPQDLKNTALLFFLLFKESCHYSNCYLKCTDQKQGVVHGDIFE